MHTAGQEPSVSRRTLLEIAIGAALIVSGMITLAAVSDDSAYVIGGGPIFAGLVVLLHGTSGLAGYKSFVAWRYLLNHRQRVTPRTRLLLAIGLVAYLPAYGMNLLLGLGQDGVQGGLDLQNPLHLALLVTSLYLSVVVFWGVL